MTCKHRSPDIVLVREVFSVFGVCGCEGDPLLKPEERNMQEASAN